MARLPEAVVIVLDIGKRVGSLLSSNGETFLHNAQLCATKIILRKILSGSKDEISLILVGSEDTNNQLTNDNEDYKNIEISHCLQIARWDMVKTISSYQKSTNVNGDWLDAVIVAADHIRTESESKRYKEKKIVLLTDFEVEDAESDELSFVIQGLQKEDIELVAIGIKFSELICKIINEVKSGIMCSFEDAIPELTYCELKKVRPTPWRAVMNIGSKISIPVVGYKKVAEVKKTPVHNIVISYKTGMAEAQQKAAIHLSPPSQEEHSNGNHSTEPDSQDRVPMKLDDTKDIELIDKDRIYQSVGDDKASVDVADVINGYMFGTTVVPVNDDDMASLVYDGGPRCLSVLGFTDKTKVPMQHFKGEGCYVFFSETEENCTRAFAALLQAMDSTDKVAIARKVYNKNSCPVICALFPLVSLTNKCFVCFELPYAEEVKTLLFPPLVSEKNKPSPQQLDVVDRLITNMALNEKEEEETGTFDPLYTLDPYEQHFHNIVAKKALNRDMYFSGSEIDQTVKLLLSPSEELVEAAKPVLEEMKNLFELTEITPKEGARRAAVDVFKQVKPDNPDTPNESTQPRHPVNVPLCIGTVHPQEDFKKLLDQGVSLDKACNLLARVITDLVLKSFDSDDFIKPMKTLGFMREVCLGENPSIYNDWIVKFRKDLPQEKEGFWHLIVNGHKGLITNIESKLSSATEDVAKQFLTIDDDKEVTQPLQSEDEDLDDLINQM